MSLGKDTRCRTQDQSGDLMTLSLDITLPALHQGAIKSRTAVKKTRDSSKIEVTRASIRTGSTCDFSPSPPVSHSLLLVWGVYVMKATNFEFLCLCRKRNPDKFDKASNRRACHTARKKDS